MKHHLISATLAASILLLAAGVSNASENKADEATKGSSSTEVNKSIHGAKSTKAGNNEGKHKGVAIPKPVDVNSAGKEELKKLPGIGDAEAAKIIAGRPYCSKAWLVYNKVIPQELYAGIASRVEVRLPDFKNEAEMKAYCKRK